MVIEVRKLHGEVIPSDSEDAVRARYRVGADDGWEYYEGTLAAVRSRAEADHRANHPVAKVAFYMLDENPPSNDFKQTD